MGRTISYNCRKENGGKFTDQELELFVESRNRLNSEKTYQIWSCENFWPEIISFHPNWNGSKDYEIRGILRNELNNGDGYAFCAYLEERVEKLTKGEQIQIGNFKYNQINKIHTRIEAYKTLAKDGWITITNEKSIGKEVGGFVKVQGNEFNAAVVYLALKELSLQIPKMQIYLYDEGEFLLCPIRMQNGKAIPLISEMHEAIKEYAIKMLFSKDFKGNVLKKLDHKPDEFTHEFKMSLNLDNSYGDMTYAINEKLRNIKIVENRIAPLIEENGNFGKSGLYITNLEKRKPKDWFEADLFTRLQQVKSEDFITYKMTPATLMDGFDGNYYGLSTKDSEAESYKHIAQMQKVLGKLGLDKIPNAELVTLGEENIK